MLLEILTGRRNHEYCITNQGDSFLGYVSLILFCILKISKKIYIWEFLNKVWRRWTEGAGFELPWWFIVEDQVLRSVKIVYPGFNKICMIDLSQGPSCLKVAHDQKFQNRRNQTIISQELISCPPPSMWTILPPTDDTWRRRFYVLYDTSLSLCVIIILDCQT